MMFLKRFLPLALVTAALLSSCSTLCCDKASSRIEADIAIATNRKEDADAAQKDAYRRMSWAEDFGLEDDFSEEYQDAIASFHPANMAYDDMKYGTARKLYLEVSAILSDDFQARATECRDEKAKVDLAMTKALEACADTLAPQRFKDAQDLYIKAKALKAAGDLPNAITTCKKASAAFEYAFEYATVMKLRDSIRDCEILKEYNKEFLLAESKIMEDEALWKHGTVKDYALGTSILREAGRQYSWILEQCRKLQEEKRIAVEKAEAARLAAEKLAQEKAAADGALACAREGMAWTDEQHLEVDYVDDYEKGKALLADAESRYASGDYVGATASANEVCSQFGEEYRGKVKAEREQAEAARLAAEKLAQEKAAADGALACAREGMAWTDEQHLEVDYVDDYEKGKALLADAESRYASGDYVGATASANEVCSQFGEEYRGKVKAEREQAEAARLAAEKLAQEKAAADGALACAREGMAWTDEQHLEVDYVDDYEKGKALLADAESRYASGDYVGATASANEVCSQFGEEYRGKVKAEREQAEAARLAAEKLAQEKAAADGALACAREGMAWTDEQHLEVDYVDDYEKGKALLADAESRYASGDYVGATASANEVCSQFGEEYRGKVKAEREQAEAARLAAEKLAQEKAAADGALACARAGMIWADEQRLEVDYADDYEKGKALLADAESRYASGDYVGATASANEVCSQFGEEYRGKVKAERGQVEAARLAAEKLAQEKLAAEKQQEPVKAVVKTYPEYFSPDDDGLDDMMTFDTSVPGDTGVKQWVLEVFEEYIVDPSAKTYSVSKRSFITWFGTGTPPEKIAWDGKSDKNELVQSGTTYPYIFSYTDKLDRVITTQGAIIVGIIAQKTGDTINIKLPSLVFRADKADFLELDPHVIERNNLLVGKLAESLNKYSDYNITVEGHANNVGKIMGYSQTRIQEEENTQVLPLSIARAEKLRSMLIEQGIDPNLISVVGYGSSRPVVSFTDAVNRWKNRRVEFTLTRKK